MRTRIVALSVLATVLLAGCAGGADVPGPPLSPPEGTVTSPEPSRPATPEPTEPAPTRPPAVPIQPPVTKPAPTVTTGDLTISGEVAEGVEPGCLVLRSGAGEYLLVLPAGVERQELRPGRAVTVRGRIEPDLVTTCQQGTPFVVSEVVRR